MHFLSHRQSAPRCSVTETLDHTAYYLHAAKVIQLPTPTREDDTANGSRRGREILHCLISTALLPGTFHEIT